MAISQQCGKWMDQVERYAVPLLILALSAGGRSAGMDVKFSGCKISAHAAEGEIYILQKMSLFQSKS
jgi:hypothetical protein